MLRGHPEIVDDFFGREWVVAFLGAETAKKLGDHLDGSELRGSVLNYVDSMMPIFTCWTLVLHFRSVLRMQRRQHRHHCFAGSPFPTFSFAAPPQMSIARPSPMSIRRDHPIPRQGLVGKMQNWRDRRSDATLYGERR